MKKKISNTITAVLIAAAAALPVVAQPSGPDFTITAEERREAIEGSIARLKESYVFPDVAVEMEKAVRDRMGRGEYDRITSGKELAAKLTDDFRAVSRDKHLTVFGDANGLPENFGQSDGPTAAQLEKKRSMAARQNFGFEKVERLEGNVGYLEIRQFAPASLGAETGAAAMNFIANSDALIVDLRRNGGGDPAMIAFLSSYLFDGPTHLNDIYNERKKSTRHFWTLPHVPGPKFGGTKPVFVLTSNQTFSAGEEFAYNLKSLKRATILGETTGGGAHPVRGLKASRRFAIGVPFERAINPITKTNWEGTGVAPDLPMPDEEALDRAYVMALEAILAKTDEPQRKAQLERVLSEKKSKP